MTKKKSRAPIDLFYGGVLTSVLGICLIPLYRGYAVIILIAGLIAIFSSAWLIIKQSKEKK